MPVPRLSIRKSFREFLYKRGHMHAVIGLYCSAGTPLKLPFDDLHGRSQRELESGAEVGGRFEGYLDGHERIRDR